MGLIAILKGEQPGIIKSMLNYENLGQFGEYTTEYALTNNNLEGDFVVLKNLYIPYQNKTSEIDLLMIHEKGIYVFESKNYSGWIFGNTEQLNWTQCLKGGEKNKFYNPIRQNKTHIKALSNFLGLSEDAFVSYVVFSERCTLKDVPADTENVVIVRRPEMLRHLRKQLSTAPIIYSLEIINQMADKLVKAASVTEEEKQKHIDDINTRCPFCGNELVLRKGKYGDFWGCSSYPKCSFTRKV